MKRKVNTYKWTEEQDRKVQAEKKRGTERLIEKQRDTQREGKRQRRNRSPERYVER